MRLVEETGKERRKQFFSFRYMKGIQKIHGIFTIIYGSFGNADINGPLLFERAYTAKIVFFLLVLFVSGHFNIQFHSLYLIFMLK